MYSNIENIMCYDSITGVITAKYTSRRYEKGAVMGSKSKQGYILIKANNKTIPAHRLAWFLYHKEIPIGSIDHIDNNKSNNAIDNLRLATRSQNGFNRGIQANSTTGIKGLVYYPNTCCYGKPRYKAQVRVEGKIYSKSLSVTKLRSEYEIIKTLSLWMEAIRQQFHKEFAHV